MKGNLKINMNIDGIKEVTIQANVFPLLKGHIFKIKRIV